MLLKLVKKYYLSPYMEDHIVGSSMSCFKIEVGKSNYSYSMLLINFLFYFQLASVLCNSQFVISGPIQRRAYLFFSLQKIDENIDLLNS